jgi:hypothetical protein
MRIPGQKADTQTQKSEQTGLPGPRENFSTVIASGGALVKFKVGFVSA